MSIDVIIPVYGAGAELGLCLESVAAYTQGHRVLLVLDGPQDARVEAAVHAFLERHALTHVLRNESRVGFVRSVNRGMRASTNDVVLLNSDTIVTPRWIEKLSAAAASTHNGGTVTPFSNHATLASIPRPFSENLLPSGFDVNAFAALVERVSARSYPRLPTGVGFCLYIRRALLDDIGSFDEERFGFGYGEENDFCMRATKRGWVHLLDDATFIFHAGGRSFRGEKAAHLRRGTAALKRLHPGYFPAIVRFLKEDPLAPARERILRALAPANRTLPKVAHLVHGWPPYARGGVEMYARWLVREQVREREVAVYARIADPSRANGDAVELLDEGARVRLVTNNFLQRDPFSRNTLRDGELETDFAFFLRDERPDLLHVHHTAGHAFSLVRIARKLGIPVVHSLHDWWSLCARVNLFDKNGRRCNGPALMKCARCVTLTRVPPASITNVSLHRFRQRAARAALAHADAFVMPSAAIRDDFANARILPRGVPLHVLEYGIDLDARTEPKPPAQLPLRFGCVGAVLPHKGLHLADEAFASIDPAQATLHIFGNAAADPAYAATLQNAKLEGTFADDDRHRVFDSIDVLLMPSIGLESFGLVAREAMTRGVPVLAARDGALAEIRGGAHFESGNVVSLRAAILALIDEPARIDAMSRALPPVKSAATHAKEIAAIYETTTHATLIRRPSRAQVVTRVIRGEGLPSAVRRARGRVREAATERLLLARAPFIRALPHFPILNLLATPATSRLGGVQVHLLARLRAERAMRPVALLTPGLLQLTQPRPHARRVTHRAASPSLYDETFKRPVRDAANVTGSRILHLEGADGIPTGSVLELIDEGFDVIVSLHDFALLADDPHQHKTRAPNSERHLLGTQLLQRARAVVYPSRFLERAHGRIGTIIPASIPAGFRPTARPRRAHTSHPPRIAIVGNVIARKGAHLIEPILRKLRGVETFVFGGGNAAVLTALRAMPSVSIHGHYAMGTLPELLARHDIDVVLLLSIEPEIYSLTLSESWLAGVPVIAFAHGAIEERIQQDGGGWLVPLEQGVDGIVARIERWLAGETLPRVPTEIPTADDSARLYAELYRSL